MLGPILFLLYANYIMKDVQCTWTAFADDFKIGVSYSRDLESDIAEGTNSLQRDLSSISLTAGSWNLKLNPTKCVIIRFGQGTRSQVDDSNSYWIEGKRLQFVSKHRDLGIVVDSSLKFHNHVGQVVGKVGCMMGDLLRSTICRSKDFMVTLFVSHIRPIIDYGSCLWNVGYLGDVRKLESLQRRWTREIDGLSGLDYISRLKDLGLFSVYGRLLRLDLIKIWRAFNSEVDVGLSGLFEMAVSVGTRGHSFKMSIPVCRTEIRRRSFGVRRVLVWNGLPSEVVEAPSVTCFKRRLDASLGDVLYSLL